MLLRSLFILFFILCTPITASAGDDTHHSDAQLFSSVDGVGQLKNIQVGVAVHLDSGWKTYWRTPGEAGLAPVFDWAGSSNIKESRIQWPAPSRFTEQDIDNFGYQDDITFPIDLTLQDQGKPVVINLKLDLLLCNQLCVPATHHLSLTIPATEAKISAGQERLAQAGKKIPATGEGGITLQRIWLEEGDDKAVYLNVSAVSGINLGPDADMFVETSPFVSVGKPSIDYNPQTQRMNFRAHVRTTDSLDMVKKNLNLHNIILTVTGQPQSFERTTSLSSGTTSPATESMVHIAQEYMSLDILLLAFLGGLILNLMPCVLPVLSLKILSVLSHGGKDHRIHRWTVFRNFTASAMGILCSFWLMAAALVMLKNAGQSIGWGIQFQHPGFLIFLIVVLAAFAANMWGLYEIPLPRFIAKSLPAKHEHEPTLLGHFLTGAFATLLATPCTAPFLGTAVGFALARESHDIFIVFTFLGLGLAFPYIVLALSPRIFKYMPKPGKWMVVLKKILAGALVITAIWLFNVLVTVSTQATMDEGWTRFDEALIKPAVEDGRTVIVDVTADWCLTCKANKRLVLDQRDVEEAISGPNILRLQADWTRRDEGIAAFMKKYGRYGIPFNIIYGPGAPDGIILNELLSKQEIMRALAEAASE